MICFLALLAAAPFDLEEATIAELQQRMTAGKETSRSLVEKYRARIEAIDRKGPELRSVIELNPDAIAIADALDAERKAGKLRGPLHGVPVLLKDNIDTADRMATSAGSLALAEGHAPEDAEVVRRLREAGAVILGKTNLSEWANFRSMKSTSGWSARGGQTKNPYALDRSPLGSSSGSAAAVAANLTAIAVGTETDGSIVAPASVCGIVGIKPTLGLVSRRGIIPIAASQDTAGPMARTVADALLLLQALAGEDAKDPITVRKEKIDLEVALDAGALKGARIGVVRNYSGKHVASDRVFEQAIEKMRSLGATIVDPVQLEGVERLWEDELLVLETEFKTQLDLYLAGRNGTVRTLEQLIAFNDSHADRELAIFGQELLLSTAKRGPLTDRKYRAALARGRAKAQGAIDKAMKSAKVEALIAPTGMPAALIDPIHGDYGYLGTSTVPAIAGTPHVTVPAGSEYGLPIGVSFFGRPFSEKTLIRLAYAFEQAAGARKPPTFPPTVRIDPRPDLFRAPH